AKTIGEFLDRSALLVASVAMSSLLWALVNTVAGTNTIAMAAFFAPTTYAFSIPRAMNPSRFFAFSLCGPVFVFTAIQSVVGAYGPNTSAGAVFDSAFLVHTIYSYLIGIGICLVVNVFVFPDFAERKLQSQYHAAMSTIASLSSQLIIALDGSEASAHAHDAQNASRMRDAKVLRTIRVDLTSILDSADSEICYSRYSMHDHYTLFSRISNLAGIVESLETAMHDPSTADLLSSSDFQSKFDPSVIRTLSKNLEILVQEVRDRMNDGERVTRTDHVRLNVQRSLLQIKQAIGSLVSLPEGESESQLKIKWQHMLQANYLVLGVLEMVEETLDFHWLITGMQRHKQFRFNHRHFLPSLLSNPKTWSPTSFAFNVSSKSLSTPVTDKPSNSTFQTKLRFVTSLLLTTESIYGFKCALALLALHGILISEIDFANSWCVGANLVPLLIALTPSLGQTFVSLPVQIASTSIGALAGFIALTVFGLNGSVGIVGVAMVFGAPFMYLMLFTQHMVLGLLTLLAFNYYVVYLYTTPGVDPPSIWLGKTVASMSVALAFALSLTLIVFPTLSRNILHVKLSGIIKDLSVYYTEILLSAFTPSNEQDDGGLEEKFLTSPPQQSLPTQSTTRRVEAHTALIPASRMTHLRNLQHAISTEFTSLPYLIYTSEKEPTLHHPFPTETYKSLISTLEHIFQSLESARYCIGKSVLDEDVREMFGSSGVRPWRGEMNQVNRLLFYIYSTAMIARGPLPYDMPNAVVARKRFFDAFVRAASEGGSKGGGSEWMRVYGLSVALQEASRQMDLLGGDFKKLFGELPDLFLENPDLMWRSQGESLDEGGQVKVE
ncbi:hypothetical protein HDU79_000371, partial [Rhizoclosmatium sp. JEL0117]